MKRILPILSLFSLALFALALCAVPCAAQTTTPVKVTLETMAYTDQAANSYPASVWVCASTNIDKLGHAMTSTWYAYPTLALASQRQTGGVNQTVGQHSYSLSGAAFLAWYAPIAAGTATLTAQENTLTATLDTEPAGHVAGDGAALVSFFAGGAQSTVTVNVPNS